jgi:hypothetical protein
MWWLPKKSVQQKHNRQRQWPDIQLVITSVTTIVITTVTAYAPYTFFTKLLRLLTSSSLQQTDKTVCHVVVRPGQVYGGSAGNADGVAHMGWLLPTCKAVMHHRWAATVLLLRMLTSFTEGGC